MLLAQANQFGTTANEAGQWIFNAAITAMAIGGAAWAWNQVREAIQKRKPPKAIFATPDRYVTHGELARVETELVRKMDDQKLNANQRFADIEKRFDRLEPKIDRVNNNLNRIMGKLDIEECDGD